MIIETLFSQFFFASCWSIPSKNKNEKYADPYIYVQNEIPLHDINTVYELTLLNKDEHIYDFNLADSEVIKKIDQELRELNKDCKEDSNTSLDPAAVQFTRDFLVKLNNNKIKKPYLSYNSLEQISLSWENNKYSLYLTISKGGEFKLSVLDFTDSLYCNVILRSEKSTSDIITEIKRTIS